MSFTVIVVVLLLSLAASVSANLNGLQFSVQSPSPAILSTYREEQKAGTIYDYLLQLQRDTHCASTEIEDGFLQATLYTCVFEDPNSDLKVLYVEANPNTFGTIGVYIQRDGFSSGAYVFEPFGFTAYTQAILHPGEYEVLFYTADTNGEHSKSFTFTIEDETDSGETEE